MTSTEVQQQPTPLPGRTVTANASIKVSREDKGTPGRSIPLNNRIRPPIWRQIETTLLVNWVIPMYRRWVSGGVGGTFSPLVSTRNHKKASNISNYRMEESPTLPRGLVPEPLLCVEVKLTMSNGNFSTSHTSLGSFSIWELAFHIPGANFCNWGSTCQRTCSSCHRAHNEPDASGLFCRWWAHKRSHVAFMSCTWPEPMGKSPVTRRKLGSYIK